MKNKMIMTRKLRTVGALAVTVSLIAGLSACAPAQTVSGDLVVWDTGLMSKTLDNGKPDMASSYLNQMAVAFEKANPGTKITVKENPGKDITTAAAQFQAAAIAGKGPDVRVQYAGGPTISFGDYFTDLDKLIKPDVLSKLSGINVNREGYKPDGRLLGLSFGAGNMFTIFQNNAVVTAAGLDPTKPPTTWEELLANGQQVKDKTGKNGFWAADLEGYVGAWMVSALVGGELGQDAFTKMYAGKIPVDDPAMVKAYDAFAKWGKSGLTNPDAGQVSNGDSTAGFVNGSSAYYLVGSWENENMLKAFGKDGVSSFFIPMLAGAKYPHIGAGGPEIAISIAESSKHKDLAAAFITFLAEAKNQDVFVKINQTQASNHVDGDPAMIQSPLLRQEFEQLTKATDGVTFAFDSVMPQATIDLFYRVNAGVFNGSITPEDAVAQLKASYTTEIANQ